VRSPLVALALGAVIAAAPAARGQDPSSVKGVEAEDLEDVPEPAPPPRAAVRDERDDRETDPVEPDFVVVNLPSQARLPGGGWAFRVTHRFARPLGEGDLGDLASDLFGLDSGGQIGLELRYGIARATQVAVHRTSDRTIQLFAQRDIRRAEDRPFGLAVFAAIDGRDNFTEDHSPSIGALVSRRLGERGAVYAMPAIVAGLDASEARLGADSTTAVIVGLGVRFRFSEHGALLFEATPRLNAPDVEPGFRHPISVGLERTVGGHAFQLNVSNSFGTTIGQMAGGGAPGGWYIGFNIARKFY
jgi:hypothetical protein